MPDWGIRRTVISVGEPTGVFVTATATGTGLVVASGNVMSGTKYEAAGAGGRGWPPIDAIASVGTLASTGSPTGETGPAASDIDGMGMADPVKSMAGASRRMRPSPPAVPPMQGVPPIARSTPAPTICGATRRMAPPLPAEDDVELQPLKAQLVIGEAMRLLRSTLPTSIRFKERIKKNTGLVMADPTQIHQIIMNLCTNAAHAMGAHGGVLSVEVDEYESSEISPQHHSVLAPGKYLRIRIGDTGCGMSPEIMASIFDPYFTTKELGEGTGLGLSVVHGIVKESGGDIMVESRLGEGSVFTILLPFTQREDQVSADVMREEKTLPGGSEHILVVEDEMPILKMTRRILEQQGYRVTSENEPHKALQAVMKTPRAFDLVLTDITMPGITGDRLASHILAVRPDMPVVLMTGFSRLVSDDTYRERGIKEIMMKPLARATLIQQVRKILDEKGGRRRGQ